MEQTLARFNDLPSLAGFIILLAVIGILSFAVKWLWHVVIMRLSKGTKTTLDDLLFGATMKPVQMTFIMSGVRFAWDLYSEGLLAPLSDSEAFDTAAVSGVVDHILFILLFIAVFRLAWNAVLAVLDWYEREVAVRTATTLDDKIIFTLRKIVKTLLVVFAAMVISDHFNLGISKIWAAAGIGSLAVALAAKDTFANMISGALILIDRPFLVGDRVELADGTYGDVVDIGLRSTRIMSFDNTIHIIPNADIATQRITNHTYPDFKIKIAHVIGVAYGSDMERVKKVLDDILKAHPHVLDDPAWGIWFTDFGDSSLNLLVKYWVEDYRDKFTIKDQVNMEINRRFALEGIEIPFPQRDVHIIGSAEGGQNA